MLNISRFIDFLKERQVEFISGVPDTLLNDFCVELSVLWEKDKHIIAANEGNAIAHASGYHLATNTVPVVYMQNSGMGNAMNPLISLTDKGVYSIPLVMLIGWRGEPGSRDWPQHQRQGELSTVLLDALNIPFRVLDEDEESTLKSVEWAISEARVSSQPTALLVRKGVLARGEKMGFDAETQIYSMSREDAIRELVKVAPRDTVFVASTGRITRELHAIRELLGQSHDQDFLNVGAMGHTLSIAAGIATAHSNKPVVCLDGDAAALMHMGSMAVSANLDCPNLMHVVLNNGVHESVGGQHSVGFDVNLTGFARNSGYHTIDEFVETQEDLVQAFESLERKSGPAFLEVRVRKGMRKDMPILNVDTLLLKEQLGNFLKVDCL